MMIVTDPETLTDPTVPGAPAVRLVADASDTDGAASVENIRLRDGGEGAPPHLHKLSHELFYVVDGRLELWIDGAIHELGAGQAAVVPPSTPHAFGAAPGADADLLVTIAPGVERFEYFRVLAGIVAGVRSPDALHARQDEFDTYFIDAPEWATHRARS